MRPAFPEMIAPSDPSKAAQGKLAIFAVWLDCLARALPVRVSVPPQSPLVKAAVSGAFGFTMRHIVLQVAQVAPTVVDKTERGTTGTANASQ